MRDMLHTEPTISIKQAHLAQTDTNTQCRMKRIDGGNEILFIIH